jgi:hypothetical protein
MESAYPQHQYYREFYHNSAIAATVATKRPRCNNAYFVKLSGSGGSGRFGYNPFIATMDGDNAGRVAEEVPGIAA